MPRISRVSHLRCRYSAGSKPTSTFKRPPIPPHYTNHPFVCPGKHGINAINLLRDICTLPAPLPMNLLLVAVPPWRIRVESSTVMLPSSVPRWQADAWGRLISWDAPLPVPPPARFLAEGGATSRARWDWTRPQDWTRRCCPKRAETPSLASFGGEGWGEEAVCSLITHSLA